MLSRNEATKKYEFRHVVTRRLNAILTVCVCCHGGAVGQEQLHDLQGARLGAVVQRRVALDGLAVDVGADVQQVLGDLVVALVARDHQAGVSVAVRHLDVWKRRNDSKNIFFYFHVEQIRSGSTTQDNIHKISLQTWC